jgi:uncharacterized protein YodC (DUF2158 family)
MSLNTGQFNVGDLVKVFALPNLYSVEPGNKVMLRSGGPCMIVYDSYQNLNDWWSAKVRWDDEEGKTWDMDYDLRMLTCWGAIK